MAVRLAVIMVHSPPARSAATELAESIVGELIGMPEIDLTLVGPLAELADGSTDRLTLESLSGDVAVLDWHPAEQTTATLNHLGFVGDRAPHAADPEVASSGQPTRRIYVFDLNQFLDAPALCQSIEQLKSMRQTRTFGLQLPGGVGVNRPHSAAPEPTRSVPPTGTADATGSRPEATDDRTPGQGSGSVDLDDLLDRLDALDP